MFSNTILAFIGSGAMAEAMISGLIAQKQVEPQAIIASGPRPERGAALQSIPKDAPKDVEERVRLALQYFAKP